MRSTVDDHVPQPTAATRTCGAPTAPSPTAEAIARWLARAGAACTGAAASVLRRSARARGHRRPPKRAQDRAEAFAVGLGCDPSLTTSRTEHRR